MKRTLFFVIFFAGLVPRPAAAVDQVLLPVVTINPIPGAHESVWVSRLWITNVGPDPVTIATDCSALCPPATIPPGGSIVDPAVGNQYVPATFLTASNASNLRVSLRILDLSRQATSAGTEIPTIRPSQFSSGTVDLVGVPVDPRFRLTLRVYAPAATSVDIRALSTDHASGEPDGPAFSETRAAVNQRIPGPPAYLQVDSFLADNPALADIRHFRIEVSPVDATPIWAFLSITNDDTQQVTTITPHP